jgi:uncharacterized protein
MSDMLVLLLLVVLVAWAAAWYLWPRDPVNVVTSSAAPLATGWSESCRAGITAAGERRLVTAHSDTISFPRFQRRRNLRAGGFFIARPCTIDSMKLTRRSRSKPSAARWYQGADVPMRVIRRYARQVAERFHPERIILFGSHAYGTPHADSDVDILVIMPARNQLDQAFKIRLAVQAPFPLDLIVRKPRNIGWRLDEGELFHTEILTRGKVLYEKSHAGAGAEGRKGLPGRRRTGQSQQAIS